MLEKSVPDALTTPSGPPESRRRTLVVVAAFAVGGLVAFASLLGLFAPWPYRQETADWVLQGRGQDLGNLLAVAVLIVGALRMRSGSAAARQVVVGSLLYFLYAYIVYAFALHFGRLFLVYVAVLGLTVYTLIVVLVGERGRPVLPSGVARTFAAWVLICTGAAFALLWLSEVLPATITGEAPPNLQVAGLIVNPIHVIDLSVVLPGMILVGVLALRGSEIGSFWLLPILVFSVLMGTSIVATMVLTLLSGNTAAIAPLILVTAVVGVSLGAAIGCVRGSRAGAVDPTKTRH
ncbi:hypothetical protein [Microbacterium sp. BK668]|uniref:hypothetical protein n=1 Tax=Microbacterium sp. BK668 TaxID=2512118 RepID=UPI00105D4E5D|nr:hypothetical protein [Microbacterium sp. BK668]TDN87756.1 hypothetical protein EV279_3189 [Microbacterium sp. BK668]